ncbi:putative bifunctional diguanylate cyclase/phosphodiesterase [Paractinoplanes atraurantiacus]|uniref:Diguanylate cyclase (GGDEF) domain-containing protein n=1 Tax=Paractinoplanes atraurantiacus TaxID=1036182 RepID=A0A285ILI2_9ACTN|nr:GGDEF domain-containing phosphodiesterase [Actinoplanes atraurantiacus]SNY47966.1 diguanylate cyclase (GGDEF) domain-containing protein [Actinoplanes atraurantiacus]
MKGAWALAAAVAEVVLIVLGTHAGFPWPLVWAPAVVALALAVAGFRAVAVTSAGALRTFWRRLTVAMGFVLAAALSQVADLATATWSGMPPIGARTLLLYVVGTVLAISALLRLPSGGRSWRQITTAVLDVAVVAVTAGIAGSEYLDWFIDKFGVGVSAWWLNIAMMAIAVAGVMVVVKIMSARQSPVPRAALWWLAPIGLAGPLSTVLMTLLLPWPHLNGSAAVLPFVGLFGVMAAHRAANGSAWALRRTANSSTWGLRRTANGSAPVVRGTANGSAPVVRGTANGSAPVVRGTANGSAQPKRGTAIPLVATGLTSVLLATVYLREGHLSTAQVAGTTLLLLLVVARQAVALAENATLLDTVAHRAAHDDLTGLYNRRHFTESVAPGHTVVLIDLREFRAINDGLGPDAGDALLIAFADRLTALAGPDATVARLGGDEFGVLLPRSPHSSATFSTDISDLSGGRARSSVARGLEARGLEARGSEARRSEAQGSEARGSKARGSKARGSKARGSEAQGSEARRSEAQGSVTPGSATPGKVAPGSAPADFAGLLVAATAEPLRAAGHDMIVEVSVGIGDDYREAEVALREAAGGLVVRYDASLERELRQRATLAADLRRALNQGEFHLLYQPVVTLPHGEIYGVESLVRWTLPSGEIVSPADFIPVAEDTGLIVELGAWIIDTACAQAAAWPGLHSVAVNVSARQLLDPALPDLVASALARHGVPPKQLTVEITETAVFGGGRALATVKALSALGVSIALDDFGTGHSSLGLLRTCPVDVIKVDKSFVDGLGGAPEQEAVVTALTGIATTMGLRTVAEGVETAAQAERLHQLGYRHVQGFHFARPLPAAAVSDLLAQDQRAAA